MVPGQTVCSSFGLAELTGASYRDLSRSSVPRNIYKFWRQNNHST